MSTDINQIYNQVIQCFEKKYPDRILRKTKNYAQYGLFVDKLQGRLHYEFVRNKNSITCEFHFEHKEAPFLYTYLEQHLFITLKKTLINTHALNENDIICTPKWKTNNGCGRVQIKFQKPQGTDIDLIIEVMNGLIQTTQAPLQQRWIKHFSQQSILTTKETIWDWIVNHRGNQSPTNVSSPGPKDISYPDISLNISKQRISGTDHPTKVMLENQWHTLVLSSSLTPIDQKPNILKMWAFGWSSLAGLVDNKPFPYKVDSTTFYLRYIPVNLDLFDSVMAELGLRRQPTNNDVDKNVAVYKPSDWISEIDESDWWVEINRTKNSGFKVTVHQKDLATQIEFKDTDNVKQFGEYDFSQPNANTLEGETEGRFFVSWPEKMLLQEFLKEELKNIEDIKYTNTPPKIWWASFLGSSSRSYNKRSLQSTSPYVGIGCGLLNTDWSSIDINSSDSAPLIKLHPKSSPTYVPFLLYIRPNDYCYNMSSKEHYSIFSEISFDLSSWHNDLHNKTENKHIFRPLRSWTQQAEQKTFDNIQQQINTTIPVNRQIVYGLGSLKTKWDNEEINFTDGFSQTEEYTPLYKDFIEQRAKVLDPTSRALLVHLKYNTPIEESPVDSKDDDTSEEKTVSPTEMNRKPDSLSNNDIIQRLTLSKNLILEGVPGTGKTYAFNNEIVKEWKKQLGRDSVEHSITMHPSTSYEDFLEGLRPQNIEQRQSTQTLNIPLKNNRFIIRETKEIIYVEDRTENALKVATVPKSILGEFLQHAAQQTWDKNYNQGNAKSSFDEHTTWNIWPLTDGATFHGVAKYYLEHDLTVSDSLIQPSAHSSTYAQVSICSKYNTEQSHWFFQQPTETKGNFTVSDGFFLNVCKEAVQNPSKDFLVLLDEINRCNIPSVFGDLLTAIERSKRATWDNDNQCWNLDKAQTITLAISKRQFFVPENVYVVGTMNTTDRSVAPMDMALRRRFAFHRIEPEAPTKQDFPNDAPYWDKLKQSIDAIKSLNDTLSNSGKDALLGYSYIYDLASDLELYHNQSQSLALIKHHWSHHILPQLADIIFSNQISGNTVETLLKKINDDTHGFTIENTSTNTENSFERPSLKLKLKLKRTLPVGE